MIPNTKQIDKLNNLQQLPIVRVRWVDATSKGGWRDINTYRKDGKLLECISVGMVIANDKDKIQLIQSISENSTLADSITIPKTEVKEMVILHKKK